MGDVHYGTVASPVVGRDWWEGCRAADGPTIVVFQCKGTMRRAPVMGQG